MVGKDCFLEAESLWPPGTAPGGLATLIPAPALLWWLLVPAGSAPRDAGLALPRGSRPTQAALLTMHAGVGPGGLLREELPGSALSCSE